MKTIRIATTIGWREVRAIVFGVWAVNRLSYSDDLWSVTHVPTGRSLSRFVWGLDLDDATTIAEALHDSGIDPTEMSQDDACMVSAVIGAALAGDYVFSEAA